MWLLQLCLEIVVLILQTTFVLRYILSEFYNRPFSSQTYVACRPKFAWKRVPYGPVSNAIFALQALLADGLSVSLQGSSSSVILGQGFQFSCEVTGVASLQGLLYFNRESSTLCTVNTADCTLFSNTAGYFCGCLSDPPLQFYTNISSVTDQDDSNDWRCQYSGQRSASVNLDVYYAPVVSLDSDSNVIENTSPNIDCSRNITSGNPSSTSYMWTGPGNYSKTGAVLDRTLSRTQGGQYTCTATNTAGLSDRVQVKIDVLYPPTIHSIDRIQNVTENSQIDIDCSENITFGNPSSTSYRWTGPDGYSKNGTVLDRMVTRTERGLYNFTATNTAGLSDIAEFDINVFYAPSISTLQDVIVTEGSNIQIDCSRNITPGDPPNTVYEWTDPSGNKYPGHILDNNITRNEGGQYTCTASNTAGLSDTGQLNITVLYPPTINIASKKNIAETTSPNIDCSNNITSGNPSDISYEWTGPNRYNSSGPVLDTSINRTEGGEYTCTATNTAELSDSARVSINVQFLDSPTLMIAPAQVMENESVQLACNVTSNPTVQMSIKNVDNNTNLVNKDMTNSRQYVIERAHCLHNGTYQCIVLNREITREETDSSSLSVLCSPRHDFRKELKTEFFRDEGETATITAHVISNPPPTFTWWKYVDDQLEPVSNYTFVSIQNKDLQSSIQITVTRSRDYGTYTLKMENQIGESILQFKLSPVADSSSGKSTSTLHIVLGSLGVLLFLAVITIIILVVLYRRRNGKFPGYPFTKPGRYDETNCVSENHSYEGPFYVEMDSQNTGTVKTMKSERVNGSEEYCNQPTYINEINSKGDAEDLEANAITGKENVASIDSKDEVGEYVNLEDPLYEPVGQE